MMPNTVVAPALTGPTRLKRASSAFAVLALVFAYAAPAPVAAQDANPVVARVNGAEIRASDLAIAEEELGANVQQIPPEARQDYLISYLADTTLVAQAAEARKLADSDEFKRRMTYARNKLLMETLLQTESKVALTDEAMRKVYDEAAKQMGGEKEVRARHILVETEDEAKAVSAELAKGTDFAELAKQKSKDPGAAEGGDLGYFTKDQMVPEFSEAAFQLDAGKVSTPVKSQFGWHVIKVEDKRDRPVPPFEQVKPQIETYLVRKNQADLVAKLREGAKIERVGADGKPQAPASAPEPKKP